jgi:hypothetical protein
MAAKRKNPVPAGLAGPRVAGEPGEPVGAFLEVLAKTRAAGLAIDRFEVTNDLVLEPPTEARNRKMDRTRAAYLLAQTAVLQLMQYPEMPPEPPRPLPDQVSAELDRLASKVEALLGSDADPVVVEGLRAAVTATAIHVRDKVEAEDPDAYEQYLRRFEEYTRMREGYAERKQKELQAAYDQGEEALSGYNEALVGDEQVYQRVNEFFDNRPYFEREAFENGIKARFLRLPEDGKCRACGSVVDPKAPNSEQTSSTGLPTTGTSLNPISPSISAAPTPETGSAEPDAGTSSSTTSTG